MKNLQILLLLFCVLCIGKSTFAQDCPDSCAYFIPNNLTLDCDGIDCEILQIQTNCPFTQFNFTLYNRWGEIIFHSEDSKMRFNSNGQQTGVYYYTLKGEFCNNKRVDVKGNLTIVR